jgi:hypothetical protein
MLAHSNAGQTNPSGYSASLRLFFYLLGAPDGRFTHRSAIFYRRIAILSCGLRYPSRN